jgi:hypothetical protein
MSREFLEAVHRLATDEAFRTEFLAAPEKHLIEMGVSPEMVKRLVPAVMTAFVSGGVALNALPPILTPEVGWR